MPRFNPKQQQKKLRRHNPVARADPSLNPPAVLKAPKTPADALPILTNLPTTKPSASSPSTLEQDESIHRSLMGLNPLLLAKSSRAALLNPKHKLLHRLVNLLDHPRLEIRKEAAGCLRNLCVEGQWSIREQLWQLGGGSIALSQVQYAAEELGLIKREDNSKAASTAESGGAGDTVQAQKKPEDMNRKERRQAAKAARAAASNEGSSGLAPHDVPVQATRASVADEIEAHELLMLHLNLLENHLTILWCLLEGITSPVWITTLNRSTIGSVLPVCLAEGTAALTQPIAGSKISQKEELQVRAAKIDMAVTSANLLAAWLEDNPAGAASIAGLPLDLVEQVASFEQAGNSIAQGSKSRKRLEAILDKFGSIDTRSRSDARQRLHIVLQTFDLLVHPSEAIQPALPPALEADRLTLGLLALASSSNLVASLPSALRSWVPVEGPKYRTLSQWHAGESAPRLARFTAVQGSDVPFWETIRSAAQNQPQKERRDLQEASGMEIDVAGEDDNEEDRVNLQASRALRRLDNLQLAMELLGEICTESLDEDVTLATVLSEHEIAQGLGDTEEVDMDDTQEDGDDDDDSLNTEQEEEMLALADADRSDEDAHGDASMSAGNALSANGSAPAHAANGASSMVGDSAWSSSAYAELVSKHDLPAVLLKVAATTPSTEHDQTDPSTLSNDFVLATHSTLASLLSCLASHAQPPPSHPLEPDSRESRKVAQFQNWVRSESLRWSQAWTSLKPWTANPVGRDPSGALSTAVWTSLHALLVMHEGAGPLPFEVTADELKTLFGSALDATLARCDDSATATSDPDAQMNAAATASLIVSSLAYLSRSQSPSRTHEGHEFALNLWLTLLSSAASVNAAVIVATINSFVDTYADENAPWDEAVFVRGGVLAKISDSNIVAKVKDRAKSVDKRRQADLRESIDEAASNLAAFIEYRASLS